MCSYETVFLIAFVLSCAMALRLTSKLLERFPLASGILVRLLTTTGDGGANNLNEGARRAATFKLRCFYVQTAIIESRVRHAI